MGLVVSCCAQPRGLDLRGLQQLLEAERRQREVPGPIRSWRTDELSKTSRTVGEPLAVDDVEHELVLPVTLARRCAYVDAADQERIGPASVLIIADDRLPYELCCRAAEQSDAKSIFWLRVLALPTGSEHLDVRHLSRALLVVDLAQPTSEHGIHTYMQLLALAAASTLELELAVVPPAVATSPTRKGTPRCVPLAFAQSPGRGALDVGTAEADEEGGLFTPRTLYALSGWLGQLANAGQRAQAGATAAASPDPSLAIGYVCEWLARVGGATLAAGYWPDLPLCAALSQLLIVHGAAERAHAIVESTLCACEGLLQRVRLESAAELAQVRAELSKRRLDSHARADECALGSLASRTYARQLCEPTAAIARLLARAADACGDPRGVVTACTREVGICRSALGERHELTLRAQLSLSAALIATGDLRIAEIIARQVCTACGEGGGKLGRQAEADMVKHSSEAPTRHASIQSSSRASVGQQATSPEQCGQDAMQQVCAAGVDDCALEPADSSKPAAPIRAALALKAREALASALRAQGRVDEAAEAER